MRISSSLFITGLDAYPFDRGAPVGETQLSESTNLEGVVRSNREIADGGGRFRAGRSYRKPIGNRPGRGNRRIADLVASGFRDTFDCHDKLPRGALVQRKNQW